jgi:hypothetical protein
VDDKAVKIYKIVEIGRRVACGNAL